VKFCGMEEAGYPRETPRHLSLHDGNKVSHD
jgi:hypothetical protein